MGDLRPSTARRLALLLGLPSMLLIGAPVVTGQTGSAAKLRVTAAPIQSADHIVDLTPLLPAPTTAAEAPPSQLQPAPEPQPTVEDTPAPGSPSRSALVPAPEADPASAPAPPG